MLCCTPFNGKTDNENSSWANLDTDCSDESCDRIILTGSLANGKFYVVTRPEADSEKITHNLIWPRFTANGDDAVGLAKLRSTFTGDTCPATTTAVTFDPTGAGAGSSEEWCIIDLVGVPEDPGTAWGVLGTPDATRELLRRKTSVTAPTVDWDSSRGETQSNSQWLVVIPNKDWSNVGMDTPIDQ